MLTIQDELSELREAARKVNSIIARFRNLPPMAILKFCAAHAKIMARVKSLGNGNEARGRGRTKQDRGFTLKIAVILVVSADRYAVRTAVAACRAPHRPPGISSEIFRIDALRFASICFMPVVDHILVVRRYFLVWPLRPMGMSVANDVGAGSVEKLIRADRVHDLFWRRGEVADCYCTEDVRPRIDPKVAVPLTLSGLLWLVLSMIAS
jgi:hypothetical protein